MTVQFQPSADQAWQFWANNELTQSATYPSMFAKVHKSELSMIGCTLGNSPSDTWKVPTSESRALDLNKLNVFRDTIDKSLPQEKIHKLELNFMAENCLRQLGEPRIGVFANRQRPEPLHLEINNWEHVLDLLYRESIQRNKFFEFLDVLKLPVDASGCGLKFVAMKIEEHYKNDKERNKKLSTRLIGAQAIALARYSLRIVDVLEMNNESGWMRIRRLAMSKICESLRNVGTLMNRVVISHSSVVELHNWCTLYFNLFALFFTVNCQSTVWTLGYVVPYHSNLLWLDYKVGYGILSMQGKESKHSVLKHELKMSSNRSTSQDETGKWHQLARSSYVRNFYLPYHFPIESYHSHYESRNPSVKGDLCACFRPVNMDSDICEQCRASIFIVNDAKNGELTDKNLEIIKPLACSSCNLRFSDKPQLEKHMDSDHRPTELMTTDPKLIIPKELKLNDLKKFLSQRNLSTSGSKLILCKRLEIALAAEI